MRLSRDDILKSDDLATEEVSVPEWGGSVLVRGMTGRERDEFEAQAMDQRSGRMNLANARAKIVARCVVGDDGKRLFDAADIDVLGEKSGAALDRLFEVATRLSGLGSRDVEELSQNFGGTNGASSSSASPVTSAKPSRVSSAK
jgi:hypothetical protein